MRRYAIVKDDVITKIVEAAEPPKAASGMRVIDVHAVPASVGNQVDPLGNVSPAGQPSAQIVAPEVVPENVPADAPPATTTPVTSV